MNMCEGVCGFSFCLPAPTAEKMATDVFFRDASTIKEALVAFLMHHANFIKCGVEESRSERLSGCSRGKLNVCLPLTLTGLSVPVSILLLLHLHPRLWIKAGQGAPNHKARCQAECVDVSAQLKRTEGRIKVLRDMKAQTWLQSKYYNKFG